MPKEKKISKEEELYEKLRVKLVPDAAIAVPKTPQLKRALKFFFPKSEDAEICLYLDMGMKGNRPGKTAAQIAEESGKFGAEMIRERLEELLTRGTVYKTQRPGEPDIIEYSLAAFWEMAETMSVVDEHGPMGIAFGNIVTKYYDSGARQEWGRSKYPFFRTLVVNEVVDSQTKILSWEDTKQIIKAQDRIALAYCGCRVREHKCDHRLDTCFIFGDFAIENRTRTT